MSWAEKPSEGHRAHLFTLIDLAKALRAALERVPASSEALRAKSSAAALERALEDLEEALR